MTDTACNDAAIGALRAKVSELEALNERLAQFAYAAAHDLEEPLRKIRQYGDLLVEDHSATLNKDGQFYVNVMTSSAQRLSSLVKNLLQFASASQGDLVLKPVDLEKPFQKALDDVQHPLEEVGMVTKMGSLPTVQCDEMLVQIVFNNLVLNAIKYRAPGRSPEMTIALAEDGDDLVLSFTDNGIGFDKSEADRIFEPFVRLGSKSEAQGTGIGLAICRTICERHNWSLTASGIKDSHARFEIRIPGANRND
ncbi:MAG: ATP-binding protein [Pseudomonadota bacterium]